MKRALAGSGAVHALAFLALVALTESTARQAPGAGGGGGTGSLAVMALRLDGGGGAAAALPIAGAADPSRDFAAPAERLPSTEVPATAADAGRVAAEPLEEVEAVPAAAPVSAPEDEDITMTAVVGEGVVGAAPLGASGGRELHAGGGGGAAPAAGEGGGSGEGDGAAAGGGDVPAAMPVPLHVAVPALPSGVEPNAARGKRVRLLLEVTASGDVAGATLLGSTGVPALDESALAAAQKLRYLPATIDGAPVAALAEAEIAF